MAGPGTPADLRDGGRGSPAGPAEAGCSSPEPGDPALEAAPPDPDRGRDGPYVHDPDRTGLRLQSRNDAGDRRSGRFIRGGEKLSAWHLNQQKPRRFRSRTRLSPTACVICGVEITGAERTDRPAPRRIWEDKLRPANNWLVCRDCEFPLLETDNEQETRLEAELAQLFEQAIEEA